MSNWSDPMKMLNYFDLDPALCLKPFLQSTLPESENDITMLLHQKSMAINVLNLFWQSEMLSKNLNISNALQLLEIHFKQTEDLLRSLENAQFPNTMTIYDLLESIKHGCNYFCNNVALSANSQLRQMQNE